MKGMTQTLEKEKGNTPSTELVRELREDGFRLTPDSQWSVVSVELLNEAADRIESLSAALAGARGLLKRVEDKVEAINPHFLLEIDVFLEKHL